MSRMFLYPTGMEHPAVCKGWHSQESWFESLETWPGLLQASWAPSVGVATIVRQLYVLDGAGAKHLVSWPQDLGEEHLFARPNIFCHFAQGIGDPKYCPVTDMTHLNKLLMDVLDSYNEVNAVMNLVGTLVMAQATRARDIDNPPGLLCRGIPYPHRDLPRSLVGAQNCCVVCPKCNLQTKPPLKPQCNGA